jgi:hypothetical protein
MSWRNAFTVLLFIAGLSACRQPYYDYFLPEKLKGSPPGTMISTETYGFAPRYLVEGRVKSSEIPAENMPFTMTCSKLKVYMLGRKIEITVRDNAHFILRYTVNGKATSGLGEFGAVTTTDDMVFSLQLNKGVSASDLYGLMNYVVQPTLKTAGT